jgi:hypothetical protein
MNEISIKVYPNPLGREMLTVELFNQLVKAKIVIYDVAGRIIYQQIINDTISKHDLNDYARGIYMLGLQTVYGNSWQRLILQ